MKTRRVKLRDVVEISPSVRSSDVTEQDVSFIAMADVGEDGRISSVQKRPLIEVSKGYTGFCEGDLLLAKITPCFENGKAAIVEGLSSKVGFGSTEFHVLRPGAAIDIRFLFHLVWNPGFRRLGSSRMTGSGGQRRVPTSFIADFEFDLPPLPEQKRVAAILDKVDSLRRKRLEADHLASTLIAAAFFSEFGDAESNPRRWPVVRLEEIALQVTDGEHQTPERSAEGIHLLSARNVQNGYLDLRDVDYVPQAEFERIRRRCEPIRGDILISCSGSIGRVAQVEGNLPLALVRSVALVRPNPNLIRSSFLERYLRSAPMQRRMVAASKSSAQANLFQGPIRALPVMVPPMEKQRTFEELVSKSRVIRSLCNSVAAKLGTLGASLRAEYVPYVGHHR